MALLQLVLLILVCGTAANSTAYIELATQKPQPRPDPGWLPNIQNPLVRAAFPDANAYYTAKYLGNLTTEGDARNKTEATLVPVEPPAKKVVPAIFPLPGKHLSPVQQVQKPAILAANSSAVSKQPVLLQLTRNDIDPVQQAPIPAIHPANGSVDTSQKVLLQLNSSASLFGHTFQSASSGILSSGQQLQQACIPPPCQICPDFYESPLCC